MTILELLAFANEGIKLGKIEPTTEVMIAEPASMRAFAIYGVTVVEGRPEPDAPLRPVIVLTTNMTDPEDGDA